MGFRSEGAGETVPHVLPLVVIDVREYIDATGGSPYAVWFDSLSAPAAAKVAIAVTRMAQGNFSNVKPVGSGVLEYRIDFGPGYRIPRQGWRPACDPSGRRIEEAPAAGHCRRGGPVEGLQAQKVGGGYGIDPRFQRDDPAPCTARSGISQGAATRGRGKHAVRRYGLRQSRSAGLHQLDHGLSGTGRGNSYPTEKPHADARAEWRSEEHTSELQSLRHLVCRL